MKLTNHVRVFRRFREKLRERETPNLARRSGFGVPPSGGSGGRHTKPRERGTPNHAVDFGPQRGMVAGMIRVSHQFPLIRPALEKEICRPKIWSRWRRAVGGGLVLGGLSRGRCSTPTGIRLPACR